MLTIPNVENPLDAWCVLCGKDDGTLARCELHSGTDHKECHDQDRERRYARAARLEARR